MAYEALKTDASKGAGGAQGAGGAGRRDGGAQGADDTRGADDTQGADDAWGAGDMGSEASPVDYSIVSLSASRVVYRAGVANVIVAVVGAVVSAMVSWRAALSFCAGYIIGVANVLLLLNIAKKGVEMESMEAGRYVASRYYARYAGTIIALSVLIATGIVKAWPALAGLTLCIFTTITAIIFAARKEA